MKNKINTMVIIAGMLLGVFCAPTAVFAETSSKRVIIADPTPVTTDETVDRENAGSNDENKNSSSSEKDPCDDVNLQDGQTCVDGIVTSVIKCDSNGSGDIEDSCVWSLLTQVINIMTAGIGLLAVGGVIYGSILYTTAGGSMDQTKQAIKIIQNVIIGLVAYAFMYSFLNYVIPGGLF